MAKKTFAERIRFLRQKPISPLAGSWAMAFAGLAVSGIGGYISIATNKSSAAAVFGLIGWILVGVWFGFMRRLRRKEFIAAGATVIVITCSGVVIYPVILSARVSSKPKIFARLKELAVGTLSYTEDFDNRFPPARTWMDGIARYVKDPEAYCDPNAGCKDPSGPVFGFAYNSDFSLKSLDDPSLEPNFPMIFEAPGARRNSFLPGASAPQTVNGRPAMFARETGDVGFQPMKSP